MKKVFGILAVAALLVLPVAAYAGTVVGHGVFDEETDTVTLPPVVVTETKSEVIEAINKVLTDNSAITGGKGVVQITVATTNNSSEKVTIDRTKLEAVADGRKIESVVAPLPILEAAVPENEVSVNVILTVPKENFEAVKVVNNILFFLEHRTEGENPIPVPYREQVGSDDDKESYVFVSDDGKTVGRAASSDTPNLVIRNLRYEGDYNLSRSTTPQAVSFADGRSITFRSEFVEAAARSYSSGGGCDAGLAPLALAALAGIAFVFKKD